MKITNKQIIIVLSSMLLLNIIYIILAYTVGKNYIIDTNSHHIVLGLDNYSNNIIPMIVICSAIYIIVLFLARNKIDKTMWGVICLILCCVIIVAVGIHGNSFVEFKSDFENIDFERIASSSKDAQQAYDMALTEANKHFYFPQGYLLASLIAQFVTWVVLFVQTLLTKEQYDKLNKKREEFKTKRKERIQKKLDKIS